MQDQVEKLNLGYEPEAAVSGAFLIQDEYKTFLIFNAMEIGENDLYTDAGIAITKVERCLLTKFGYPNDEALAGHPLYRKGLDNYGIYEIKNSSWIAEQDRQNRVNFPDRMDSSWKRHFVFCFHDSTFECIAKSIDLEISRKPFRQILELLTSKFLQ